MRIIIVDDEPFAIEALEYELETIEDAEIIGTFKNAQEALEFSKKEKSDLAFLDIEMPGIGGFDLAVKLRALVPDIQIIFATGYNNYAEQAFSVDANGYILKPFSKERVEKALAKVRRNKKETKAVIEIRAFGRFDVFKDGEPIVFKSRKAKELLALCVDHRGGQVTMEEACDKLWEDRPYDDKTKKLYRKAVMIASHNLAEAGADDVFKTNRGLCYIDKEKVDCDYYRVIEGCQESMIYYNGEYLFEYDWAEETIPEIEKLIEAYKKN
ncbi:MAG: response regulator [Eubacterium sp.]